MGGVPGGRLVRCRHVSPCPQMLAVSASSPAR
jgi:hypothetical protein